MPLSNRNYFQTCLAGFVTITVMTTAMVIGGLGVFALVRTFSPMEQLSTWSWFWFWLLSSAELLVTLGFGWWAQRWLCRKLTAKFFQKGPKGQHPASARPYRN